MIKATFDQRSHLDKGARPFNSKALISADHVNVYCLEPFDTQGVGAKDGSDLARESYRRRIMG